MSRQHKLGNHIAIILLLVTGFSVKVAAQKQAESKDMDLVGSNDLQGRSSYQPTIHKQGNRYIAYVGHHSGRKRNPLTGNDEDNGTSIVDVTNPKQPVYLAHIPGAGGPAITGDASGAQMVRVCDGSELPHADKSKVYMLRTFGNSAHEIWDVTDPSKPSRVTVIVSGLLDTHKSWWECDTGIAYLVSGPPDWRTKRMLLIFDLSDPAHPVFIRTFGLQGQQTGSTGPVPAELHGPISTGPKGNRVYIAYGDGHDGIIQIVDRQKLLTGPKEPTEANLLYPQIARVDLPPDVGAHTAFPMLDMDVHEFDKNTKKIRDFLAVPGETGPSDCHEPTRQMLRIFDISTESRPLGISTWTVPEASGNFCERGGRFGAHSVNENLSSVYYKKVVFLTFFNAGVRAIDIRDPFTPKEIGYYIPAVTDMTDQRCSGTGAEKKCKTVIQTNNVDVDDRGYIYIVDRADTGMHILELTGEARKVAGLP